MATSASSALSAPTTVAEGWVVAVFSVPGPVCDCRHRLRALLVRLGFGQVTPGVWIAPSRMKPEARRLLARAGLSQYVSLFMGEYEGFSDLRVLVARAWDLTALDTDYRRFIALHRRTETAWRAPQRCAATGAGSSTTHGCWRPGAGWRTTTRGCRPSSGRDGGTATGHGRSSPTCTPRWRRGRLRTSPRSSPAAGPSTSRDEPSARTIGAEGRSCRQDDQPKAMIRDGDNLAPSSAHRRMGGRSNQGMKATETGDPEYFHRVVDCQWACPAHTNVPEYIRLIAQGRYTDAYMVNRESNVFPAILGRTCDRPCEPACRRGRWMGKPVAICRLKRVAADLRGRHLATGCPRFPTEERQAHRLYRRRPGFADGRQRPAAAGLRGRIFEKHAKPGGLMRHQHPLFPPAARPCWTKKSDVILDMGVDIRYNTPVEQPEGAARARASMPCSSARGAPRGKDLEMPGRHETRPHPHRHRLAGVGRLRPHRLDRRAGPDHRRRQHRDGLLPHVAPPGRQGHQGHGPPPRGYFKASPWELEDAEEEGVDIVVNHAPKRFVVEDGKLKGMEFERLEWDADAKKSRVIEPCSCRPTT